MKLKQEVQELFPTPLWTVDIPAADAVPFNANLKAEIEKIIAPRPKVPSGSNWQTPQDLHTRPAFAEFVKLVEIAAGSVARARVPPPSQKRSAGSSAYTRWPRAVSARIIATLESL